MPRKSSPPSPPSFRLADQEFDPAIDVASIREHPDNYNQGNLGVIEESMREHGFFGGILVQKSTRFILVGNHRYRSAVEQSAAVLPGFWLDVDDDEAARIMAVDNRAGKLAEPDERLLISLLSQAAERPRGLAGTGYDSDALAALIRHQDSISAPPDDNSWDGLPEFDQGDRQAAYRSIIHFPTLQDADAFFALIDAPKAKVVWWPQDDGHQGDVLTHRIVAADPAESSSS